MLQKLDFDVDIFDSKNNKLNYTPSEIDTFRIYLSEFLKEYPIIESVDTLLMETFNFKCDILAVKDEKMSALCKSMEDHIRQAQKQDLSLEPSSVDHKLLEQSIQYCLASLAKSFENLEKIPSSNINLWKDSNLYKMTRNI